MSPVGHSLVGLAIGLVAICGPESRSRRLCLGALFVAVANLPDWPLPGWGHSAYLVSHSLFVNGALIGGVSLALWCRCATRPTRRLWLLCLVAWLSHLLLDSMYGHGLGLAIAWPVSDFRLTLPVPWLPTLDLDEPLWGQHNLSVGFLELLTFGPLLIGAMLATNSLGARDPRCYDRR